MINLTERLDKGIRVGAWAHEQQGQHRKGTDVPYFIHPVGVMLIANLATDDEDVLLACLLHDVLEDVDGSIYSEADMLRDFGGRVLKIVKDVTKDGGEKDWHKRSEACIFHLGHVACDEAVTVYAADKIHNIKSILTDYNEVGDDLWNRFRTKNAADQLWWYESILGVLIERKAPEVLTNILADLVEELRGIVVSS